jgi:glycosyltransferase involved in cell wall biosynthesis
MACGRAIVSTTAGCAGLGLADSGELLIRDSSTAFADGLGDLLGDAELRRRIALRARQTAEARFSWPAIAEDALRSYQSLLG